MKILVRDGDTNKPLGPLSVTIKHLGSGIENVTVKIIRLAIPKKIEIKYEHSAEEQPKNTTKTANKKSSQTSAKPIYINLSLPTLPKIKLPSRVTIKKYLVKIPKKVYIISSVCIILLTVYFVFFNRTHKAPIINSSGKVVLEKGMPSYDTVLPKGKNIVMLGGWTRISPPNKNPVYAYVDKITNIQISVSEQPLPDNFKSDTEFKMAQLGQSSGANNKVMADKTVVYIGDSTTGQSVIFTKHNLLILIKSTSRIATDQWISYINSLQ